MRDVKRDRNLPFAIRKVHMFQVTVEKIEKAEKKITETMKPVRCKKTNRNPARSTRARKIKKR